ncbi:MAG: histidine phosphatase family protein [Leifsonia sp.]
MVIALVRHGQTDWNLERRMQGTSDIPLNALGREQALAAGALLAEEHWDVIVSSPLVRARETASIIADRIGLPLGAAYVDLGEQHFGEAEGGVVAEVMERWPDRLFPGMEPDADVEARGFRALTRIVEDFGDANVIAVAHGTLIRATLAAVSGRPRTSYPYLDNGSSTRLRVDAEGWRVLTVGGEPVGLEVETA